ncbi:hypothetical protein ACLKA6_014565 [Drosophila palustris]
MLRERRRHAHYKLNSRLDRKSSRGMIYENEELRLRTININAEVERGQSDIKRLRRENEQLRREIWTLRDECDRLNKRFKAKLNEHEFGGCRGSGGSGRRCSGGGRGSAGCDGNSDDSDSCDTCRCEDDGQCSDECCQEGGSCVLIKPPLPPEESGHKADECHAPPKPNNQPFDHLSVVSEETLSNPEMMLSHQPEHLMICTPDLNGSQSTLPSLVGPLTPLTPIELVANQLSDLQATVPPLSYFENILQNHMGHNTVLTPTPELGTSSSTTTGKTMKHTNGWDYNLQSPFSQRKYSSTSSPSRSPPPPPPPTLTTFVPTATLQALPKVTLNLPSTSAGGGIIETVAITTNATQQALNSPKHFFAPIKPRLKLNTKLANQNSDSDPLPPGSPPPPLETAAPLREPPDIFVNNALASPYQRPAQRLSPQVSPRHRARTHCQLHHQPCQAHAHVQGHAHVHGHGQQQRQHQCQQQQPQMQPQIQQPQHCSLHRAVVNVAAAVGLGVGGAEGSLCTGSVVDIYTAALSAAAAASAAKSVSAPPSPSPSLSLLPLSHNVEPVYATAQKSCHSTCKSASALTKPLMTVSTGTTKTSATSPLRQQTTSNSYNTTTTNSTTTMTCAVQCTPIPTAQIATSIADIGSQTDSVNLESILNDIETISEDILAIQLEKNKSRDNLMAQNNNDKDSTKKPYRSEMNLYLQYDATNPTTSNGTTATTTTTASHASDSSSGRKLSSRTRSLEREHTDSPAPHMPDPMAPFPEKCSYLGFEQLNQAAGATGPSPTGQKPPVAAKPNVPAKPPPPLPPARRPAMPTEPPPTPPVGLSPNKSHLYKSLASAAAAKRAIFQSSPSQLTRSLDAECPTNEPAAEASDSAATNEDDEATRRKARRVSIVCGEEQPLASTVSAVPAATTAPTTTASCIDLTHVLTHPSIKAFKQMSHSTPSSPHSSRRRTNSNTMTAVHAEVAATNSAPPSTTHHHHHRKEISDPAPMTATVSRTKCSRRHSEGTVHNVHRISNSSGGAGGGHHHHHTHHHQHNSLISSNPHHSHHSHQDSNHETVTSLSDRNSNSFGSSRESSTSFSMRSNRRKISISSHTGGKIPWCGCWGNGCL